jgi:hypothetical protein
MHTEGCYCPLTLTESITFGNFLACPGTWGTAQQGGFYVMPSYMRLAQELLVPAKR